MVGMMGWSRVMEAAYGHDHPTQQQNGIMGETSNASGLRKGPWTPEEDKLLSDYVTMHGEGRWSSVAKSSGLNRSGKSCRLRWVNYLRPGLKRGQLTPQEEGIIIELHSLWGNKWSTIVRYLPGRTDNEIKNYWRTHFKKKDSKSSVSRKSNRQHQSRRSTDHEDDDGDGDGDDQSNTAAGVNDDTSASHSFQAESSVDINRINNHGDNRQVMFCTDQEYDDTMSYKAAAAATSRALDDQVMYEHYEAATWTYHVQPEERNVELWTGLWNLDDCSPSSGSLDRPNEAQIPQTGKSLFFGD